MRPVHPLTTACVFAALLALLRPAAADPRADRLLSQAPGLSRAALELALSAYDCARRGGLSSTARRLAVIDYSLPSTEVRMWVFDLARRRLLHAEHVAHGRGSGDNLATEFSNREGSHQSSLGLFAGAETYQGANGYSLRLDGLEPGFNDQARARAIVMHGADYVDPQQAQEQGRLGRSFGCPAVRRAVAAQVINHLRNGQLLFSYYPDPNWLARSPLLGCPAAAGNAALAAP